MKNNAAILLIESKVRRITRNSFKISSPFLAGTPEKNRDQQPLSHLPASSCSGSDNTTPTATGQFRLRLANSGEITQQDSPDEIQNGSGDLTMKDDDSRSEGPAALWASWAPGQPLIQKKPTVLRRSSQAFASWTWSSCERDG
jgi:hypothetical protein